jgi:hypothetical protein
MRDVVGVCNAHTSVERYTCRAYVDTRCSVSSLSDECRPHGKTARIQGPPSIHRAVGIQTERWCSHQSPTTRHPLRSMENTTSSTSVVTRQRQPIWLNASLKSWRKWCLFTTRTQGTLRYPFRSHSTSTYNVALASVSIGMQHLVTPCNPTSLLRRYPHSEPELMRIGWWRPSLQVC